MSSSPPPAALLGRRKSLRSRLFRALAVVGATLVVVCALSTAAVTRLGGAIGLILRENYVSVVACQEMNEALERQDSAALFSASGRSDIAVPLFAQHRAGFARAFAREAGNVTLPGEGAASASRSTSLYRDYVREVDRVLSGSGRAAGRRLFQGSLAAVQRGSQQGDEHPLDEPAQHGMGRQGSAAYRSAHAASSASW